MVVAPPPGVGVMGIRSAMKWWCLLAAMAVSSIPGGGPRAGAQNVSRTWLVIISGASGEPQFATEFATLGAAFRDAATQRFGIADSMAIWLAEDPARDRRRITGRSTRGAIDSTLGRIATISQPNDRLFVLLLGHGSSQGGVSRFNIPGPDLTDVDFRNLLDRFTTQSVVFVNATSASGDFVKTLSGTNRIILTATKSGAEGNQAIFARFFIRAYTDDGADVDKDGRVSLLEAFQFARREVQRDYDQGNRLLTEHAILDDNGDGVGRGDPGASGPDGLRARSFYLAAPMGLSAVAARDPRAAALLAQRTSLEASIDSLRARKASLAQQAYEDALESLLVKLAETNKALREFEGKKP